jgi:class 3 adenylate cyclase
MESPPIERRLAAILSADVEGYSRLMHIDDEATMTTLSAHRAVVDDLIGRHRGRIANTAGDSVLAEFASVLDAVRCAIEIQEAIERANEVQTHERQMRFRLGVNVGDVMVKDGDIFGDGVNVAARLEGSSPAPTATSCAEAARFSGVEHNHRGGVQVVAHPHTAKEIGYGIADRDVEQPFFRVQRRSYPNPASTAGCIIRAVPSVETGFTLAGDRIKSPYWFAIG